MRRTVSCAVRNSQRPQSRLVQLPERCQPVHCLGLPAVQMMEQRQAQQAPIPGLELGAVVGKGSFGIVYRGWYKGQNVAVKASVPHTHSAHAGACCCASLRRVHIARTASELCPRS